MLETTGIASNLTALPSGGGGIAPMGDRFQPDLVRGSGNYTVPLNLPKGPNECRPTISLTYSTSCGNGLFGQGWRMDPLRIERRTDRGFPSYTDDDSFVLGDAQVLVPAGGNRYRPQADTSFWMIERAGDSWRIRTGDGRELRLGQTAASRETNGSAIFSWMLDEEIDPAGNRIRYSYIHDGGRLYLDAIFYSIFTLRLHYEDRPDVLRNGRAGFERLTRWRAASIDLDCARLTPAEMRRWQFTYGEAANGISLLQRVSLSAAEDGVTTEFPDLSFAYTAPDFTNWDIMDVSSEIAPPAPADKTVHIVDFNSDGLPDIVQTANGWVLLWKNDGSGALEGPVVVSGIPATVRLDRETVGFADLSGKGRVDLFSVNQPLEIVYHTDGKGGFETEPVVMTTVPGLKMASPDTRLMDIDGDGITDVLVTGRNQFLLYQYAGGVGWQEPAAISRLHDLEHFPDVSFSDKSVRLADMTGDGSQDIVSAESGRVAYWPYLGNGHWGDAVEMEHSPRFPEGFRDEQILLADFTGNGNADLVHIGPDAVTIWFNCTGHHFMPPMVLPVSPVTTDRVIAADWLGDGRPGLLWYGSRLSETHSGYRFLRLGAGMLSGLLAHIDNGMGGIFEMVYSTSTRMRHMDLVEGSPWNGVMPLTMPVLAELRQIDTVTSSSSVKTMRYHDGIWDGPEREFRGFSRVLLTTSGDTSSPAMRQEHLFFMGDPEAVDLAARARERALAGALTELRTYEATATGFELRHGSTQIWEVREEVPGSPGKTVWFPHVSAITATEHSPTGAPNRIERTILQSFNSQGLPRGRRRESFAEGAPVSDWIVSEERFTYTANTADWIVRLPVRCELRDRDGNPLAVTIRFYDGPDCIGLPEGQATHGLCTRTVELRLSDSRIPGGYIGSRDLSAWGYIHRTDGDCSGWYAATLSVRRDAFGNVAEQIDATGIPTRLTYDADGVYPLQARDALGRSTAFTFNPRSGDPSLIVFPDGRQVRNQCDPMGRLVATWETDDSGIEQLTKCWVLDQTATPVSITSIAPENPGRSAGELTGAADVAAIDGVSVSRAFYDGFGNVIETITTAPDGLSGERRWVMANSIALNARGQNAVQYAPRPVPGPIFQVPGPACPQDTCFRYDSQNNVVESIGPAGTRFRVVRDTFTIAHYEDAAAGMDSSLPPPGPPARIEHFDSRGRLIQIDEFADGATITARYSLTLDGRMAAIHHPGTGATTTYDYAAAGEPLRITHPDAGVRTYYRDAANRVRERVDADNGILAYCYDGLGRVTSLTHQAAGSSPVTIREVVYDTDPDVSPLGRFLEGRVALVREGDVLVRYSYNRAGRMTREATTTDGVTLSLEWCYSLQGRLQAIVYPDGRRVDYTLDRSGAVSAIPGVASQIAYAPEGTPESWLLANGVTIEMPLDPVSRRLSSVRATLGGVVLRELDYTYGVVGTISAIRDTLPGSMEHHIYTYDGLHRLTAEAVHAGDAAGALLTARSYSYDPSGNVSGFQDTAGLTMAYTDAAHPGRLTGTTGSSGVTPLSYDSRGHLNSYGNLSNLTFDPLDRLVRVQTSDGQEIRFTYDSRNRRVMKTVTSGAGTSRVRYAAGLFEQSAASAVRHIFLGKRLVGSEKALTGPSASSTLVYYLTDHHATVLLAMDSAGAVVHQQRYSPFGASLNSSSALNKYLGLDMDGETGLVQLGVRYYAPVIGRFISPDWFVLENPDKTARLPQACNLYGYAMNNPLSFKDPSGLFIPLLIAAIAAIAIAAVYVTAAAFAVGFIAGLAYGLSHDQGWESLLTGLEAGLTTVAGMWLGGITGFLVAGPVGAIIGAVMGGMNGLISGVHGIYNWGSAEGWFAFLSDSTWGLLGTSLGNMVHVINLFYSDSNYRHDLSHRRNRHVYEGGFALKSSFAFTQGNVISNAGQGGKGINDTFITQHEELHVWQGRIFGPFFQATYVAWGVAGLIVGSIYWCFNSDQSWGSLVETSAYYDNPFEYWAYNNNSNWRPSGANSELAWG
ncbi:MAG: toxin TcdB middle/N-terminal domain-containing protein [Syntrophobacteraceae bacterium]